MKTVSMICFLLALTSGPFAERGRVQMAHGTVVTDQGRNLRGAFISTDWTSTYNLPSDGRQKVWAAANTYGLNTVHVYLEKWDLTPGCNVRSADSIVEWTSQAGMYCVITIGCGSNNGSFNLTQAKAFWNFYAGRYANRTHVVYEIHNEPENECNSPMSSATIDMISQCYDIIRSKAPNTHIIAFSNSAIAHTQFILSDIASLKAKGAIFGNMSIGYHGYYWCVQARDGMGYENNTEALALDPIIAAGYSVISTEFEDNNTLVGDTTKNGMLLKHYEGRNTSWLCFFNILGGGTYNIDASFKSGVNAMGLTWRPDHGVWPLNSTTSRRTSTPSIGLKPANTMSTVFGLDGKIVAGMNSSDGNDASGSSGRGTGIYLLRSEKKSHAVVKKVMVK